MPFWYGSNALIAWGINAFLFPGLCAAYEVSLLIRGRPHAIGLRFIALPAALFAAVMLWTFVQVCTWVPTQLVHPIWGMAAAALGRPVAGSISVNRDLTNLALLRLITAASVFWLALQLSRNADRAHRFIVAIASIGAAYAAYGLVVLKTGQLPWLLIDSEHGIVSSTFYNQDSYATYAGIGLIASSAILLLMYEDAAASAPGRWHHRIAMVIEATGRGAGAPMVAMFLIAVALLLTGSRGGVIATGIGLVTLAALWRRDRADDSAALSVSLVLGLLLIAATVFAFGDLIAGRLQQAGVADPSRVAVYQITLRSILDNPFLGFGYGTFVDVFPMYRDRSISVAGTWGQAHDTYLEVLQGLGLVFGSMLIGAVALLVLRCARGATRRRRDAVVPRIAGGVGCLVGAHALVDFSLQMQAVALTFMAILGAGVAQSESSRQPLND